MRILNMDPIQLHQLLTASTSAPLQQQMLLNSLAASMIAPNISTPSGTPATMPNSAISDFNMAAFQQLLLLNQCTNQASPALSPTNPFLQLSCHPLLNALSALQPLTNPLTASTAPTTPVSAAPIQNMSSSQAPVRKSSLNSLAALQSLTLQIGQAQKDSATPPEGFSISSILNMSTQSLEAIKPRASTSKPVDALQSFDNEAIMALLNAENVKRKISSATASSPATPTESGQPSIDFISMLCPPVLTPNGSVPSTSPSTSQASTSSKTAEKEEDDDSDLFVDVESIEVAVDGKDRRKAHVEFYRKIKSMRQREKILTCAVCKKKVENVENTIQTHVNEHADAGCYQCRLCGWQSNDKYRIYEHMRKQHPRKVDKFQDKRDMQKMCQTMVQCFPRPNSRPKKESDKSSDIYMTDLMTATANCFPLCCQVCKSMVRKEKQAIIRHVQSTHTLKCKACKIITITSEEQLAHQLECHSLEDPKISVHYAPSAAAMFLLPALEKCFPLGAYTATATTTN